MTSSQSWGAGWRLASYILLTTVVSCLALVVNMGMIYVLFMSLAGFVSEPVALYGGQFMLYVGPYMLLFLEWRLWDSIADPFRRYSSNGSGITGE